MACVCLWFLLVLLYLSSLLTCSLSSPACALAFTQFLFLHSSPSPCAYAPFLCFQNATQIFILRLRLKESKTSCSSIHGLVISETAEGSLSESHTASAHRSTPLATPHEYLPLSEEFTLPSRPPSRCLSLQSSVKCPWTPVQEKRRLPPTSGTPAPTARCSRCCGAAGCWLR